MSANISQGSCPQHGVADGMDEYIGIGMAFGPLVMGYFNPSQPEGNPLFQAVHIISETYAETHGYYRSRSAKLNPRVNLSVLARGLLCPLVGTR
jgi:hypothetical protein